MPIKVKENPLRGKNSLLSFTQKGLMHFDCAELHFSYIPDREIVEQTSFTTFLKHLEGKKNTLEDFSNSLVESFYREVLPFYVKLDLTMHHKETGEVQRILTVEKQPQYKIPQELESLI